MSTVVPLAWSTVQLGTVSFQKSARRHSWFHLVPLLFVPSHSCSPQSLSPWSVLWLSVGNRLHFFEPPLYRLCLSKLSSLRCRYYALICCLTGNRQALLPQLTSAFVRSFNTSKLVHTFQRYYFRLPFNLTSNGYKRMTLTLWKYNEYF